MTAIPSFTTGNVSIFRQALYKDGAAKITKDRCLHGLLPASVEFLSPSQAGYQGAVRSVANQMKEKTGEMPTLKAAASELGSRAIQGAVRSVANQMKEKTGEMPTLKAAASELGSRAIQGAVRSVANQMKEKTGEMPTLMAAASELGSRGREGKSALYRISGNCAYPGCNYAISSGELCENHQPPKPIMEQSDKCRVCSWVFDAKEQVRGGVCNACYYKPEARAARKKVTAEKKATRGTCSTLGCNGTNIRGLGKCCTCLYYRKSK